VYDFGCIQGSPDASREGAAAAITRLAAPGATLLLFAFSRGRLLVLPRGMDRDEVVKLFADGWQLVEAKPVAEDMPRLARRASPSMYRFTRTA
jgi:hypothetical protein